MQNAFSGAFAGKKVLVTGHTGFKGAWLCLWLRELGARVVGYALAPDTKPSLFLQLGLASRMESHLGDIRDPARLKGVVAKARPEIVFHLAAQALVRRSYRQPADTFSTNVLGTVHLLEAVRACGSVLVCQVVTSDKCYENRAKARAFLESDPLGGKDPYSASKACAELAVGSYRDSFFPPSRIKEHGVSLSSARAGNVIGGGDWAEDRILPDCVRALSMGLPIPVRNPRMARPWQHVLEPLAGYLRLCSKQLREPARFSQAWNFGPAPAAEVSVGELADQVVREWGSGSWKPSGAPQDAPEAETLKLDCDKAARLLGWRMVYGVRESVAMTVEWYRKALTGKGFDARGCSLDQIRGYCATAARRGLAWAKP